MSFKCAKAILMSYSLYHSPDTVAIIAINTFPKYTFFLCIIFVCSALKKANSLQDGLTASYQAEPASPANR